MRFLEMDDAKDSLSSKNFAPSSLVDLKAELFRKQKEYKQQKAVSSQDGNYVVGKKISKPTKKKTAWGDKNSGVEKRIEGDGKNKTVTDEDEDNRRLEASRAMLEAKTKLYERMSKDGDNAEDEDGQSLYLVDFERKYIDKAMESRERRLAAEHRADRDNTEPYVENEADIPDDEKWVDYTDALGRTRRCMKKDLSKIQSMDSGMKNARQPESSTYNTATGHKEESQASNSSNAASSSGLFSEAARDLMSADMHREMLREKWEKEQQELLDTQDTVHYSNVQFDEKRTHGVAYYQFSKQEEERQKQMDKLKQMREETKVKREAKENLRSKRKALLTARLEKVRQRRIAQGLPVPEVKAEESDSDDDKDQIGPIAPPLDIDSANQEIPEDEPVSKKVREWDVGKPDELLPQRPEKPKSWVNPRNIRDDDFAPPKFYYDSNTSNFSKANQPKQRLTKGKFGEIISKNKSQSESSKYSQDIPVTSQQEPPPTKFSSFSIQKGTAPVNQSCVLDKQLVSGSSDSETVAMHKPPLDGDSSDVGDIPLPGEDSATKSIDLMLKSLRNQT